MITINSKRDNDSKHIAETKSEISSDYSNKIDLPVTGDLSGKIVTKDNTTISSGNSKIQGLLIDGHHVAVIKYNTGMKDIINYHKSISSSRSVTYYVQSTKGLTVRDIINLRKIFLESGKKIFVNTIGELNFVTLAFMIVLSTMESRSIHSNSKIIMSSPTDIDDIDMNDMAELISKKTLYKKDNIVADYTNKVILTMEKIFEYKIAHYYSDTFI